MIRLRYIGVLALTGLCLGSVDTCGTGTDTGVPIPIGTWGGDNAGAYVEETGMHLHIGCTLGDAPRPAITADGRFEVTGEYNVDAYPVNLGQVHPARFYGTLRGIALKVTVELTDTHQIVGPATLYLNKEPQMGPCPICRNPAERSQR